MTRPPKVDEGLEKQLKEEYEWTSVRHIAKMHELSITTVRRYVKP